MAKVGAPRGNRNALKHGFYSRTFSPTERSALNTSLLGDFQDEIDLLRVLIARVASLVAKEKHLPAGEVLATLRAVTLAVRRLESLSRSAAVFSTVASPSSPGSENDPRK